MKYFFRMSERSMREKDFFDGKRLGEITLFLATKGIWDDFENNEFSDWWPVWKFGTPSWEAGEFDSLEDALDNYYCNEGDSLYCKMHDC